MTRPARKAGEPEVHPLPPEPDPEYITRYARMPPSWNHVCRATPESPNRKWLALGATLEAQR